MNSSARCAEPASESNARGAQNAPRAGAAYRAPAVAAYDPGTGELTWGEREVARLGRSGSVAPESLGEESWKWLFLQPLLAQD
jgi:phospholipid/cholesterol/gamma-HCH transport system substrate-binding protein